MAPIFADLISLGGYGLVGAALGYSIIALFRVWTFPQPGPPVGAQPPITLLKPVAGAEPNLESNLRSFCAQDYPEFQILFGVRDGRDPAIPIIERLVREYPLRHAALVVDARVAGSNYKISNVQNMMPHARHDLLVVADADCRVGPTYLAEVAAAFADPAVGAATCLYKGTPLRPRLADRLGAMFINEWFLPSVLVALLTEPLRYCFGATMAVRRDVLQKVGGFEALASYLADDYMLGHLVAGAGHKVVLVPHIVDITVDEGTPATLLRHELRWARTMRTVRPVGYALSGLTDAIPLTILCGAVRGFGSVDLLLVGLAVAVRVLVHYATRARLNLQGPAMPWLVPIRDLLTFGIRVMSFAGRRVAWQNRGFVVRPDGRMVAEVKDSAS
jgi:ceramide glucosyltransferase